MGKPLLWHSSDIVASACLGDINVTGGWVEDKVQLEKTANPSPSDWLPSISRCYPKGMAIGSPSWNVSILACR